MEPLQTPSPDHTEFDLICAEIDDFEPLPAVSTRELEREQENEEATSFDGQILAGLVSPV